MATRLLARSNTLTLALNRTFVIQQSQCLRHLHSLTSPLDLGSYQPSPSFRSALRPGLVAASSSPAISSVIGSKKILGYEKTLPRWFSANSAKTNPTQFLLKEGAYTMQDTKEVTSFSPLETISIKPRSGGLGNESLKIKRTELSQKITFALIPALVLISKSSLTTSLLVLSVYWQIHGFFKEIFLDYVHQEVTRKWVLVYFNILLLILAKDTFLDFGLV
ncbi:succinate dehydrogenase subunit 4, mitochondrial-like [Asparagus officinalis]|uniref:succinate dehydrogenase subunit 4, mitochondrial-like n=1 Tax=Asparagus officinalis TaxID=4686 RepID=UPI00098E44D9|nr:succinate dehydrogenase subunit 4, mitochondrial-like [Asparagus officinalis]